MKDAILFLTFSLFLLEFIIASTAYAEDKTRVRVTGTPQLRFESHSNGVLVKSLSVEIQNVGSVEASGVRVEVSIPNGKTLSAKCGKMAPKEKTTCTEHFTNLSMPHFKGTITADAFCSNCYE